MSPEKQRIKIAEACGWRCAKHVAEFDKIHATMCWIKPSADEWQTQELPDYLNDLNAMHEAEKVLTQDRMIDYSRHVGKTVTMYLPASRAAWMDFRLIHATAAQRAKAFLKTLNLWTEE